MRLLRSRLARGLVVVIPHFTVVRLVQTGLLPLGAGPQADDRLDDHGDDDRADDREHELCEDNADAHRLVDDLLGIALDQARRTAVLANGEDARQQRADNAADGVNAEGVEGVIIAEHVLQARRSPVTDDARGGADCQRATRSDEAGRRLRTMGWPVAVPLPLAFTMAL